MVIRTLIRHIGCHFVSHERLDRHSNSGMSATVCPTALLACLRLYVRQHCWHVCDCMFDSIAGMSGTVCPTALLTCLRLLVRHSAYVCYFVSSTALLSCLPLTATLTCLRLSVCPTPHCWYVCDCMSDTATLATVCPTQLRWYVCNCMSDTALLVCLQMYVRYCIAGMSAIVCPTLHCWYVCNCMSHTTTLACQQHCMSDTETKFVARKSQAESTWSLLEPECQVSSGDCHSTKRSHSCHTATTNCDTRMITSELSLQS